MKTREKLKRLKTPDGYRDMGSYFITPTGRHTAYENLTGKYSDRAARIRQMWAHHDFFSA